MTDTIQCLTYDDFGHIIGNNRSGTAADMSYAYDNLHGWTTKIKSAGGFEQNLFLFDAGKQQYYTCDLFGHLKSVSIGACTIEYVYAPDGRKLIILKFTSRGTFPYEPCDFY